MKFPLLFDIFAFCNVSFTCSFTSAERIWSGPQPPHLSVHEATSCCVLYVEHISTCACSVKKNKKEKRKKIKRIICFLF